MFDIERILCPVDLSEASQHALSHAVVLAGWYSARLTVLHVYTPIYLPVPGPAMIGFSGPTGFDEAEAGRLHDQVHAFARDVIPDRIDYDVIIDSGTPATRILQHAAAIPADLIVLGTHGLAGFERFMVGSVTEKVLRKAECPVLTVPPRAYATSTLPFKRLLCPVDFSEASLNAVRTALSFAEEADAKILLLHVLEGPEEDEPVTSRSFNVPEYRRLREEDAAKKLRAVVPESDRQWCESEEQLAHGKPYREILRVAEAESSDLIIMGVHGRNPLDVALFGSTTNHVVRLARCPVLTLRAPKAARRKSRDQVPDMVSQSA